MSGSVHEVWVVGLEGVKGLRRVFQESNTLKAINVRPGWIEQGSKKERAAILTFRAEQGLLPRHMKRFDKCGAHFVPSGA